jgi:Integrase core domain/Homeodomain-like domain
MAQKVVPMNIKLVLTSLPDDQNLAEWCRRYGVSRQSVYRWKRRVAELGPEGLEERSRAPHRPHGRTSLEVEEAVVAARKWLTDDGWDHGPGSVRDRLLLLGLTPPPPSEATIWRILTRRGQITPQPRKAPRSSFRRFERARPNECWQIDDTHYLLATGQEVRIINVIDDHSRLNMDSLAVALTRSGRLRECFDRAASRHGLPMEVLNDNGRAYVSDRGLQLTLFQQHLASLEIRHLRSRPYHPQTCGKVERFHQTQRRWLDARPPAATLAELQALVDEFRTGYNQSRPHRALGRRTPASVWAAQAPAGPAGANPPTTGVFTCQVHFKGYVDVKRWLRIGVGMAYAGTTVNVILRGDEASLIDATTGEILRTLTIDPTRRYQPTGRPIGRPPRPKV